MNKYQKESSSREGKIMLGFTLEVILFWISGYFIGANIFVGFGFFCLLCAFIMALIVGSWIEKNAVENHKWGLK